VNDLRVPPQNIELEQSILAGCLSFADQLADATENLLPEHFYRTGHQKIFSVILNQHKQNKSVDLSMIVTILRENKTLDEVGGAVYVSELLDVPVPVKIEHACEK